LHLAGRAIATPAGVHHIGRRPAIRTKAVPRMPAEQRLGLGERRQMLGIDEAVYRNAAQVGELEVVARLERLDSLGIETDAEPRRAVHQTEKQRLACAPERARLVRREQRLQQFAVFPQYDEFAADQIKSGRRVAGEFRQRAIVGAAGRSAVDAACRIAEIGPRAEFGADGHALLSRFAQRPRIKRVVKLRALPLWSEHALLGGTSLR